MLCIFMIAALYAFATTTYFAGILGFYFTEFRLYIRFAIIHETKRSLRSLEV